MKLLLALCALLSSCAKYSEPEQSAGACPDSATIRASYDERVKIATGEWIANDCDSMLWMGKLYSVHGAGQFQVELAEPEPGRFERRPAPCWKDGVDLGSKTTWSRDMGAGLISWAWRTRRLDVLERHFNYGRLHVWKMGFPLDDGRTLYTPQVQGDLAETIFALGGEDHIERRWPEIYPGGLDDFEAHLQVMSIIHRGEVEANYNLLDISATMKERLEEHAAREPDNALFQVALGRYTGDMGPAGHALQSGFVPSYVRCDSQSVCEEVEWLYAADIYLTACGG